MSIRRLTTQILNGKNTPSVTIRSITSLFPSSYVTLINNSTATKYYIDAVFGSDTNDGLSFSTPIQTYSRFRTLTSAITTPVMVIFLEGTYTLSSFVSGSGEFCFNDDGRERHFVCQPGKAVFNWTANGGARDAAPFRFANAATRFYGGIVRRNNNGRTLNYSTAFFNGTTVTFNGIVFNTVIAETNANNNWSLSYNNADWTGTQGPYYCTFAVGTTALSSYTGGTTFTGNFCAGNWGVNITSATFTNYVNASGAMNATTYAIAGSSGVYNGTYAWPAP